MTRYNDILNGIKQSIETEAAQKTYKGKKRSELKDTDFLFPETRSFPIVSPTDIPDAISNFGRMKGQMSYEAFLKKLYDMAKRKGPEFVAALPEATKIKLDIKTQAECACPMYKEVNLDETNLLEDNDDTLDYEEDELTIVSEDEEMENNEDEESPDEEMNEYKEDFYEMSVGSIKSIMTHAYNILKALDNPSVKNNLTESWLQGKIAVTEDYMITIHNFVMFGPSETDTDGSETEGVEKKN